MNRAWSVGTLILAFGALQPVFAVEPVKNDNLTVSGKKVTPKDLAGSDPVASFSKEDIMSVVTTGKPACKNGTLTAGFESPSTFVFADDRVPLDQLRERLKALKDAGKVSCFQVASQTYDRAVYDRLSHDLVDQLGLSIFWNKPAAKP
jgi:hypothetical protein